MMETEIYQLLSNIESDLLEFGQFIKNVEGKYKKNIPDTRQITGNQSRRNRISGNISQDDSEDSYNNGLNEAIETVKKVLERICNLLYQFAAANRESERNLSSPKSYLLNYYYNQYVYQITSYLVNMLEENLSEFSEKLNQLSSQKPQTKDDALKSIHQRNLQMPFKFKHFKPATLFTQDGKIYKNPQPRYDKSKLKPTLDHREYAPVLEDSFVSSDEECKRSVSPDNEHKHSVSSDDEHKPSVSSDEELKGYLSSDEEDKSSTSSDEESKLEFHKSCRCKEKDDKEKETLNLITKSLITLITTIEELLLQLNVSAEVSHVQTPSSPYFLDVKRPAPKSNCCSITCSKCCVSCKSKHKESSFQSPGEYQKQKSTAHESRFPYLGLIHPMYAFRNDTASELKTKAEKRKRKSSSRKKIISGLSSSEKFLLQGMKNEHYHDSKRIPYSKNIYKKKQNISAPFSENYKYEAIEKLNQELSRMNRKETGKGKKYFTGEFKPRACSPKGKMGSRLQSEIQNSSSVKEFIKKILSGTNIDKKQNREIKKKGTLPKAVQQKVSSERNLKPLLVRDLKEMIPTVGSPGDTFGGFWLLPGMKETGKNNRKDVTVKKKLNDDATYPQTILFDVNKFSRLLKEKFSSYSTGTSDEISESKLILDMVATSLEKSTDFSWDTDNTQMDRSSESEKSSETDDYPASKSDKAVDSLVTGVLNHVATQITPVEKPKVEKKFGPRNHKKAKERMKAQGSFNNISKGAHKSKSIENETGILIDEEVPCLMDKNKRKKCIVVHACLSCINMTKSKPSESESEYDVNKEELLSKKHLKGICFSCWNACQRGLTIHQCHDTLPSRLLEVRHMDKNSKICACFINWDKSKELDDWRWQKKLFEDPTRVEIQQEAAFETDPVLKVIYGPDETMVKESFAETQLRTVKDYPQTLQYGGKFKETDSSERCKSDSVTYQTASKGIWKTTEIIRKSKKEDSLSALPQKETIAKKLGRFFDDVYKIGYGKGPPLVIKLRRSSALKDVYNLLMVPSKIRLNYYRSIRVIFVSEDKTENIHSESNFIEEDQSYELFELFERTLFSSTGDFQIFAYPSEETHSLYFNPETKSHTQWFALAGTVLALAILHQKKMEIKLALCLFKCLLDRTLTLNDLREIDPLFYQKLMWMKVNNISERKRKMTFSIRDKVGNASIESELMADGSKITVTEENKFRYIELAMKWKLGERYILPLKEFRRGFTAVIDPGFLTIFSEKELQLLIAKPINEEILITESTSGKSYNEITRRETM